MLLSIYPTAVLDAGTIEDMISQVTAFASRQWSIPADVCRVDVEPLQGGLESLVARARLSPHDSRPTPTHFVVKQLMAGCEREADVYEALWTHLSRPPAVRMIGRELSEERTFLYLEDAAPAASWPWADTGRAGAVCRVLARLHDSPMLPRRTFAWDYESGLARSARQTVECAHDARDASGRRYWPRLGDLRRVVANLPEIRDRLLVKTTIVHGDVHPGNVMLRDAGEVVLIDWARARVGSPLEDVASWLHSLGCWEPEARRRHDTLLRMYLDARRTPLALNGDVRLEYWLASASNGLSGAIRYHLAVLCDPKSSARARSDSTLAVAAWARVIRRASAFLGTTRRC